MISYVDPELKTPLVFREEYYEGTSGSKYEVKNNIPRFVVGSNYADSFGFQWNKFTRTQLDSQNGNNISENRLKDLLGEHLYNLNGKTVLEVGCGAGRFTEILIKYGALVHSTDLSNAVEANYKNNGKSNNYQVAQADLYGIPYPFDSFDMVICIGVVQHTEDYIKSIHTLYRYVKSGGILVYDQYLLSAFYYTKPVLPFRFFLKRMKPEKAFNVIKKTVDLFFPIQWRFRDNRFMTVLLNRISPLYNYFNKFPELNKQEHYELSLLDTFDGLTDYHKHLVTVSQTKRILRKMNFKELMVKKGGNGVEVVAIKA
jgi:2-polyprenyl-3-methyl-5-hydroxy-6-metoxy-1,4-benzoquinol methylase